MLNACYAALRAYGLILGRRTPVNHDCKETADVV